MKLYLVIPGALFLILVGIALEIALAISQAEHGTYSVFVLLYRTE